MNAPNPSSSAWLRDKILPVVLTAAIMAIVGTGLAIWRELAIISVKIDQFSATQSDHEQRIRTLEDSKHEHP
jgi:hypothetical protein